jgi:hypothetical protein
MIFSKSDGTAIGLNGLTFDPPVLPRGIQPIAVFVAAPTMRIS